MDTRLRSLERAAALGDPDAKVGLLVHRVRSGEISRGRLELAAYLEDKLALEACGVLKVETSKYPRRWLRGLLKFGGEPIAARVVLTCHDVLIHGHVNIPSQKGSKRSWSGARYMNFGQLQRVFIATRFWMDNPTEANRDEVETCQADYEIWRNGLHRWDAARLPEHHLISVVRGTAAVHVEESFKAACKFRSPTYSKWGEQQVEMVLKCLIAGDLVPWALKRAS
jgi:hypothetical protein